MSRRRERRRASDIARVNPQRGLTSFILFAIALALILIYQFSVSEDAADIIGDIVGDPEMSMPPTVLDREMPALNAVGGQAAPSSEQEGRSPLPKMEDTLKAAPDGPEARPSGASAPVELGIEGRESSRPVRAPAAPPATSGRATEGPTSEKP